MIEIVNQSLYRAVVDHHVWIGDEDVGRRACGGDTAIDTAAVAQIDSRRHQHHVVVEQCAGTEPTSPFSTTTTWDTSLSKRESTHSIKN